MRDVPSLGIGFYSVMDAARLAKIPPVNIRRWLGGYSFQHKDKPSVFMDPLWKPQLPRDEHHLQIGFKDLIELRFVQSFINAGLPLITIRTCLRYAQHLIGDQRPFSTRMFRTDGKTIFLESADQVLEPDQLLDLRKKQYVIKRVIDRSFKDLDFHGDAIRSWRPFKGKPSIVVDPERSFGQPIAAKSGIPTVTLAQAVAAEGSPREVARLFETAVSAVNDAVNFEQYLQAA